MQNPKQAFGNKKPPLGEIPASALIEASLAMFDGAGKYGSRNWRKNKVEAKTYIHAAMRHIELWAEGQERTTDTNVHNLAAVIACCAIVIDAQVTGALIDNRSKSPEVCKLMEDAEKVILELRQKHEAAKRK